MTMNEHRKVLMLGPGPQVRGGITTVIRSYMQNGIGQYQLEWLSTYSDRSSLRKITAAGRAFVLGLVRIPRHDIIHIHAAWSMSFWRKTVFFAMARCFRKKTVVHLHAPAFDGFRRTPLKLCSRWVFTRADAVIALSETWAREIRTIAPRANVRVVPNPCEAPAEPITSLVDREPMILFSGQLESRKGFRDLIRAMPAVLAKVPEAKLVMAGHGGVEEAKALARFLGIEQHVQYLGWITGEKKTAVLSRARVFCLPSYGEGLPMAMLEAMSYGIPVIVTAVGSIPDVIRNGDSGIMVKPGDVAEISEAIILILRQTHQAQRMADAAVQIVRQNFSPDHVGACLSRLYDDLGASVRVRSPRSCGEQALLSRHDAGVLR
jgi:glycosyltransferase involved in cell wall biosynthesis